MKTKGTSDAARRNRTHSDRYIAARLLDKCLRPPYRSIDRLLSEGHATPAVRALVLGTLRHYFRASHVVDQRLRQPLPEKRSIIRCLLIIGSYQLLWAGVPAHAAIHESVAVCDELGLPWFKGLVNAVLRNLDRSREDALRSTERLVDLPDWLVSAIRSAWADRTDAITAGFNLQPRLCLRINTRKISPADYRSMLQQAELQWADGFFPETVFLVNPVPQLELPGFAEGLVSVQDAGAQFACRLLDVHPDERVLDACAAPGGKLFHLIEGQPGALYQAVERSAPRSAHVAAESRRLGHSDRFVLRTADAREETWWDGEPFDRILLDAPCTGTGTIRRRPDIKLHRSPADLPEAATLQRQLLASLWPKLAPGGTLIYMTCSILPEENDQVIVGFLASNPDAALEPVCLPLGVTVSAGWQILPDDPISDGFFFSMLKKRPDGLQSPLE